MMVGMRNFHKEKEVIPDSNFGCPKDKQAAKKNSADSLYYSEKIAYYN